MTHTCIINMYISIYNTHSTIGATYIYIYDIYIYMYIYIYIYILIH